MRLLVTNDDGIDSVFLRVLVGALRADGHEPFVVAPRHEQSWIGAAKSRNRPVRSARGEPVAGCSAWIVDGTPSDCVNIGLDHLLPLRPEAVVSGINMGLNASLGFVIASGTIAGAWEGALHGLPAVAFSQDVTVETYEALKGGGEPDPEMRAILGVSAARAAQLASDLLAGGPARRFIVHNVNFPYPCRPDTPVRRTVPAHLFVPKLFSPQADDGTHRLIFRVGDDVSPPGLATDKAALAAGAISHTILDYTRLGSG
ncbi:MAG: 5'/3'-nucleotidase SurE [Opitutaceae bacterium]